MFGPALLRSCIRRSSPGSAGPRRSSPVSRRVALVSALAALLGSGGCASAPGFQPTGAPEIRTVFEPQGPGHVFPSAIDAALDALAWCRAEVRRSGERRAFARGGTVYPVDGGFSYAEPAVSDGAFQKLKYRLRPGDALHFRYYPSTVPSAMSTSRNLLSIRDRRLVDRIDPRRRPIYYMTDDRRINRYGAGGAELERERVASLSPSDPANR